MTETYYKTIHQDDGEIAALIEEIKALPPDARDAARVTRWNAEQGPVWDAAWYAAWDARHITTWNAEWDAAWEAVLATAVRDVISPEHYATLMAPLEAARAVMLRERPQ